MTFTTTYTRRGETFTLTVENNEGDLDILAVERAGAAVDVDAFLTEIDASPEEEALFWYAVRAASYRAGDAIAGAAVDHA